MGAWLLGPVLTAALAADVAFLTVARGRSSGQDTPREVVVRTEADWGALTKALATGALPSIDFRARMVVGVFLGTRPSAGFEVEIVSVTTEGETLVVEYVERRPASGTITAQVLTEPFHLISIPKHDGPVRFVRPADAGR